MYLLATVGIFLATASGEVCSGEACGTIAQAQTAPMQADCSKLTADEQQFAKKLTPGNMMFFCNQFTPQMRQQCMQMSKSMNNKPAAMTPDQAVAKMAKDNNMMMPSDQMQKKAPSSSCPVK